MADEAKSISPKLSATKDAPNANSKINRIIAVVSGKGGVGKSTVSSMLACALRRQGKRVGIMDADVTGPSIPKAFGVHDRLMGDMDGNIVLPTSALGIPMISTNLMLDNPSQAVAWRGPVVSGVLKQFFSETNWGELDYLVVDMPPGTSDVALTIFQSLPVDGIIVVTSPQDLVEMIVDKAIDLATNMHVPVLGIVENMASFECPDCGKVHYLFGEPKGAQLAAERGIPAYATLPINPQFAALADAGRVEECVADEALAPIVEQIAAIRYDFE
ncbi:MAG: Mrp/NBP35 family ATP-binding protein [Coriobacteriia bacterium]|nr:Mrp/NBP35 family ATP-binding protein [Coriobacteriia bacterium]